MKKLLTILFAVALGLNLSAQTDYVDDWNPDADGDDLIGITDLLALLSLFAEADSDGDGIWDSVDDCIGVYDPCGVCNGTGEDTDEDGLCDDVDDCVGAYDECGECNGPGPNIPVIDEILYETDSVFIEVLGEWYVFEYATDTLYTYVCPVSGCTDETASNYNPEAVIEDGSCAYELLALTFRLSMDDEVVSDEGVFIAGYEFGNPGDHILEYDSSDSTYVFTCNVEVGFSSHYIFLNGLCFDWVCLENLNGLPCGDPLAYNNRYLPPIYENTCIYLTFGQCDVGSCMNACSNESTVTFDGYTYDLVAIGDQCWFAENLRNEHYANGEAIPGDLSDGEWSSTTNGAQAIYANDASNLTDYGRLYNWFAVDDARGLCPSGWHVPTDVEYTTLTDGLGGTSVAGGKMKSSPEDSPAWNGTNTSGFSGLAGGNRDYNGDLNGGGNFGYFWSASAYGALAWSRRLSGGNTGADRYNNLQRSGFSVRCVRD